MAKYLNCVHLPILSHFSFHSYYHFIGIVKVLVITSMNKLLDRDECFAESSFLSCDNESMEYAHFPLRYNRAPE
jgi:hypothetical protein